MEKYTKENSRITVKFIDSDTEITLFEIKDRSWMNIGELFTSYVADSIIKNEFKNKKLPKNIMMIAVAEYSLTES